MIKHIGLVVAAVALVVLGYFSSLAVQSFSSKPASSGMAGGKGAYGKGKPTSRPASGMTSVEVAPAVVAAIRERISGSGFLRPEREVQIVARTEGEIEKISFEAGTEVPEGADLCHIDERALSIAVTTARLERDQAQVEFLRFKELLGAASDKEQKDAKFAQDVAGTRFAQAKLELTYAKPTAPFAGVIVKRSVELGQHVRPGDELFVIADFEPLRLNLFFPESDVLRIKSGQRVEMRRDRLSEIVTIGRVSRVSPVVDESSLTVEVVIDFSDAPASVRPGTFGVVDIITRTVENACLVPKSALRRDDDGEYVMRVRDNVAQRVSVTTGYRDDSILQLREGIAAGDLVVVQGGRDLRDGGSVSIHRQVPVRLDPLTVVPDSK